MATGTTGDFFYFIFFFISSTLFDHHERSTQDFLIAQSIFFTAIFCFAPKVLFLPRKKGWSTKTLKHATHSKGFSDFLQVVVPLHTCNAISPIYGPISVTAFSYHFAWRPAKKTWGNSSWTTIAYLPIAKTPKFFNPRSELQRLTPEAAAAAAKNPERVVTILGDDDDRDKRRQNPKNPARSRSRLHHRFCSARTILTQETIIAIYRLLTNEW